MPLWPAYPLTNPEALAVLCIRRSTRYASNKKCPVCFHLVVQLCVIAKCVRPIPGKPNFLFVSHCQLLVLHGFLSLSSELPSIDSFGLDIGGWRHLQWVMRSHSSGIRRFAKSYYSNYCISNSCWATEWSSRTQTRDPHHHTYVLLVEKLLEDEFGYRYFT